MSLAKCIKLVGKGLSTEDLGFLATAGDNTQAVLDLLEVQQAELKELEAAVAQRGGAEAIRAMAEDAGLGAFLSGDVRELYAVATPPSQPSSSQSPQSTGTVADVATPPSPDTSPEPTAADTDVADDESPAPTAADVERGSLEQFLSEKRAEITDNRGLKKAYAEYQGIAPADVTAEDMKFAQESFEAMLVMEARTIAQSSDDLRAVFDQLLALYNSQPLLNVRSSTSMENQAYSTPAPLAYLAARMGGIGTRTAVYEPTAGNGMLLITADQANAIANELNDERAQALRRMGFGVTQNDASAWAPEAGSVDVVIANPPFGKLRRPDGRVDTVEYDDYSFREIDHLIAARAMSAMADNGRTVLIIGADHRKPGNVPANARIFFNWLYGKHNVVDHFEVDGGLYARQGAGWSVAVIVIDGRSETGLYSPKNDTIERLSDWESVYERAERLVTQQGRPDRIGNDGTRGGSNAGSGPAAVEGNIQGVSEGETNPPSTGVRRPSGGRRPARPGGVGPGTGGIGTSAGGPDSAPVDSPEIRGPKPDATPGDTASTKVSNPAGSGSGSTEPGLTPPTTEPSDKATPLKKAKGSGFQAHYQTKSGGFNDEVLTPHNMADATSDALDELEEAVGGDIDAYVAEKLGYASKKELFDAFMGLQVDAVAATIYNFENNNKGIIIADQTGVGKGRQAAAILRYAMQVGKTPVFITEKNNLFSDMYDDLGDIGTKDVRPFIMNRDAFIKGKPNKLGKRAKLFKPASGAKHTKTMMDMVESRALSPNHNMMFLTYSQINTPNLQRQVLGALGGNAIFVLDESHNAAGDQKSHKKVDGKTVVQQTGAGFINELIKDRPVLYLSATYAKRPDNMPVYYRTSVMDAVDTPQALIDAVARGGVPLQQVMSRMLARVGQLFRRERSFDGISIDTVIDYENGAAHAEQADLVTTGLRAVIEADRMFHALAEQMDQAAQVQGGSVAQAGNKASSTIDHQNFTSVVHNYVRQLLLAIKTKKAVELAIEQHKQGIKPVIGLESTMGSFLAEFVDSEGLKQGDPIDAGYQEVLLRALDRTRRISRKDDRGNRLPSEEVPLSELPPSVRAAYDKAEEVIRSLPLDDLPLSPIDYMRSELTKAGIRVSEITGRNLTIDYSGEVPVLSARSAVEQNDKRATVDDFNDGNLDALILNVAGATGLSIHASTKFKDQKPRHMIVAQPMLDINKLVQLLGRINRTGQVVLPRYTVLGLDLPAEKRPLAVAARKLKSLNANTSANSESDTSLKAVDLMNKYGDQVVAEYLSENPMLAVLLDVGIPTANADGQVNAPSGLALQVTGRMALLSVKEQQEVYAAIESAYSEVIDYLNKTGQNDLETSVLDLQARIVDSKIAYEGKAPETLFGQNTVLHKVDAKYQGKPPTSEEVLSDLDRRLAAIGGDAQAFNKTLLEQKTVNDSRLEALRADLANLQAQLATVEAEISAASEAGMDTPKAAVKKASRLQVQIVNTEGSILSYQAQVAQARETLSEFVIGRRFVLDLGEETASAVVLDVKDLSQKGKGGAFAPSKLRVRFVVASGIKVIEVSSARLIGAQSIVMSKGPAPTVDRPLQREKIGDEFASVQGDRRETRYIATGNLIAGAAELGGRVVDFTDIAGNMHQGILMAKKFTSEQFAKLGSNNVIRIRDALLGARVLATGAVTLSAPFETVKIEKDRTGRFRVQVLRANKEPVAKAVKFDRELRDLMGGDFFGSGRYMSRSIEEGQLPAVLGRLLEITSLSVPGAARPEYEAAGGAPEQVAESTFGRSEAEGSLPGADDMQMARATAPDIGPLGFFSGLTRAARKLKGKGRADQILAQLRNMPGVKDDEIEWTGLEEWLQAQEGAINSADIVTFLEGNGVQVRETVYQDAAPPKEDTDSPLSIWADLEVTRETRPKPETISEFLSRLPPAAREGEAMAQIKRAYLRDDEAAKGEVSIDRWWTIAGRLLFDVRTVRRRDRRGEDTGYRVVSQSREHGLGPLYDIYDPSGAYVDSVVSIDQLPTRVAEAMTGLRNSPLPPVNEDVQIDWDTGAPAASLADAYGAVPNNSRNAATWTGTIDNVLYNLVTGDVQNYDGSDVQLQEQDYSKFRDLMPRVVRLTVDGSAVVAGVQVVDFAGADLDYSDRYQVWVNGYFERRSHSRAEIERAVRLALIENGDVTPVERASAGRTKYEEWTEYGGTNYREVLMTLETDRIAHAAVDNHWPKSKNIVVHFRAKDRILNGVKTLFIEEIQSGWHQAGREKGYNSKEYEAAQVATVRAVNAREVHYAAFVRALRDSSNLGFRNAKLAIEAVLGAGDAWAQQWQRAARWKEPTAENRAIIQRYVDLHAVVKDAAAVRDTESLKSDEANMAQGRVGPSVARGPFRSNAWAELAIKRIIRMAAEGGYDAIAWTTGEQQGGRYGEVEGRTAGMVAFYDQILPNLFKKVGRKLDKTVQVGRRETSEAVDDASPDEPDTLLMDAHFMPLTDAIKDRAVADGQSLFAIHPMPIATRPRKGPVAAPRRSVYPVMSVSDVTESLRGVLPRLHEKLGLSIRVTPFNALPQKYQDRLNEERDETGAVAQGFVVGDNVYLITDGLRDGVEARQVLAHEVVGHFGVNAIVGDNWGGVLADYQSLRQRSGKNPEFTSIYERVQRGYSDLIAQDPTVEVKEFIAIAAEERVQGPVGEFMARVRTMVQTALRALGFDRPFSMTDIDRMLLKSKRYLTTGKGKAESPSRSDDVQRSRFKDLDKEYSPAAADSIRRIMAEERGRQFRQVFDRMRERTWTRFRQYWLDSYDSLRTILGDQKAWKLAQMTRSAWGAVEQSMEHGRVFLHPDGVLQIDTKTKGLTELLAPLGADLDRFMYWIAGNRAERLMGEDRENLFTAADIALWKDFNKDGQPGDVGYRANRAVIFDQVRAEFEAYGDAMVQVAVDSGLIDETEAAVWRTEGFYVPFYRVLDEGAAQGPRSGVSDALVRQTAFRRLKGGTQQLDDLLGNALLNWNHLLTASLRNNAARKALETAEAMGFAKKVSAKAASKDAVFVRLESDPVAGLPGGRKQYYELSGTAEGELLLASLSALNWEGFNNGVARGLRLAKRWFTTGVTASPEFKVANLVRDTIQAIAVADMDPRFWNNLKVGFQATREGSALQIQAIAAGGLFPHSGYIHGGDPDAIRHLIKNGVHRNAILGTDSSVKALWNKYQDFGARLENVNRMANIVKAINDGKSLLDANFEGRDHLDFARHGAGFFARVLSSTVAFINARAQGLDKMGRAAADKDQQRQFALVQFVYTLASVGLYLMMHFSDDDDFNWAEEWERDAYHLFKIPGIDILFRLPRPFEVGAIANMAERAVEVFINDDVHGSLFAERLLHTLVETFSLNPIPQMFYPAMEVWANKNTFTERPIETQGMERLSATERKRAYTSETAIFLSEAMDAVLWDEVVLSPVQIEHLVQGYFGWAGATVLATADAAVVRPITNAPDRPERLWTEYPMAKRFTRSGVPRNTKYTSEFYEMLGKSQTVMADIAQAKKLRQVDKAKDLMAENRGVGRFAKELNRTADDISKIRTQMSLVTMSRKLTPEQKRAKMDELQLRLNALSKSAVDRVEAARQE